LGWFSAVLFSPGIDRARAGAVRIFDCIVFAGGNLSPGVREARGNRWVIVVFVIIGFLNAYLPAYTDREELWMIDGDSIRWVGVVLFAAGGALRIWPVFVLGERFSRDTR
jgi:protein-S-isoprenylcysteine O-methyltransferase Ste14